MKAICIFAMIRDVHHAAMNDYDGRFMDVNTYTTHLGCKVESIVAGTVHGGIHETITLSADPSSVRAPVRAERQRHWPEAPRAHPGRRG